MLRIISFAFLLCCHTAFAANDQLCQGRFVNPLTDICWSCLFPLTIGSISVVSSDLPDTDNPSSPVCACGSPIPRIGITVGFWEPMRLVDVTRHPYCFPSLGGLSMNLGSGIGTGNVNTQDINHENSFYHVHWYIYPLIYWLNLIIDAVCLETQGFDVAYLTELDPLWNDDELAFILNPEAVLFANPIAQAASAADCTAASTYLPLDKLFWIAGCQGSMYPLTGHVQAHVGGVQASVLLLERMTYKLHREGILWGTMGKQGLCSNYPMPVIKKSQYRYQMTYPVATTSNPGGCHPYGRSTALWEAEKEFPIQGEDFGYLVWRKRSCCAL
jgi:conjugal transfer pilus assembly protein TraU